MNAKVKCVAGNFHINVYLMLRLLGGATCTIQVSNLVPSFTTSLLRAAMAGRLYNVHAKHTSNSQRVWYQMSWVDLQREANCPWICMTTNVPTCMARGKLVFTK